MPGFPRAALATALVLVVARPAPAQERPPADAPRPDPFCWRGRPLPRCRAFALFELGYHASVASTVLRDTSLSIAGVDQVVRRRDVQPQFLWTVGMMRNTDARSALGGGVVIGGNDQGAVYGLQGRYRRWLGGSTSAELGLGAVRLRTPEPVFRSAAEFVPDPTRTGLTLDADVNAGDRIAVGARLVAVPAAGRTRVGVLAGARLGSTYAVAGTAAVGAFFLALFALIGEDNS